MSMPSRFALGLTLVAHVYAGSAFGAQEPGANAPVSFSLPNGLAVVVAEDASVAHVAVELWVRAGSRYEDVGHWGQAHFFGAHVWRDAAADRARASARRKCPDAKRFLSLLLTRGSRGYRIRHRSAGRSVG